MSETELKFGVPDLAVAAVERSLRRLGARGERIESRYWDSADRRLAAARMSLRVRKSSGRWEQTIKAPGPSAIERFEATVARPATRGSEAPAPDLSLHAGSAAGALLDKVLPDGASTALVPLHASIVTRRATTIEIDGTSVEVALDRGEIQAGPRSAPLCEVEIELKPPGEVSALIAVGRASVDAHGMWLSTLAKSARGEQLARPAGDAGEDDGATKARAPKLRGAKNGVDMFRAVVVSCLDQVLANASVLAAGDVRDEVVHQLRIGLRRLQTAWRELPRWHGALAPGWEAPAAEVFRALGAYRDRETVATAMQRRLTAAGAPVASLRPGRGDDRVDPVAAVRAPAFQHALLDLLAFVLEPAPPASVTWRIGRRAGRVADPPPKREIARALARLHDRLKRDAKRFDRLAELDRHKVRKRLKRLRYLSELVGPLFAKGAVERFLGELEPAQDELGRYMDLVVATGLAEETIADGEARAWFDVGWLKAQTPKALARCRKALGRVADARPFWERASR